MLPFLAVFLAASNVTADTCPAPVLLPGYSHNDYRNPRPLFDALDLGYRGAEADVFRVGQELLVGHARRELESHRTLAQLYLIPLLDRARACGRILADSTPFLLNVELKEPDSTAFRLLVSMLRTYHTLFESTAPQRPEVQVTLVGWWPGTGSESWPEFLRVHVPIANPQIEEPQPGSRIGLVSIDYGKVLKWAGEGPVPQKAAAVLATARRLATTHDVPIRAHHVPADRRIYAWLLAEGVTLIGADNLSRERLLLLEFSEPRRSSGAIR